MSTPQELLQESLRQGLDLPSLGELLARWVSRPQELWGNPIRRAKRGLLFGLRKPEGGWACLYGHCVEPFGDVQRVNGVLFESERPIFYLNGLWVLGTLYKTSITARSSEGRVWLGVGWQAEGCRMHGLGSHPRRRLSALLAPVYGDDTVKAATIKELVLMYFTQALPATLLTAAGVTRK